MRTEQSFQITDLKQFKEQLLAWAQQFDEVIWLDSNQYPNQDYEALLAVEAFTAIKTDAFDAFKDLEEYQQTTKDWIFGYLSYDLKNDIEPLKSKNFDGLHFPDLYFFQPQKLISLRGKTATFRYLNAVADEIATDWQTILQTDKTANLPASANIELNQRISKQNYLNKVNQMKEHLQRGDIYEANFCQEFYADQVQLDIYATYQALNAKSEPPFACFLKLEEFTALCASPERFLKKQGEKIISQPIKGTAKRNKDPEQDAQLASELEKDPKEISENVMIVDLVRNDLSRTAQKGSVEVPELCKRYTFKQVHQLISTVTSKLSPTCSLRELFMTTYPMGSMTGAPKLSAMQIIEELEETKRGLYSGAIGYIDPEENFDFNVVIRSILYNQEQRYLSCSVGSAITIKSDAEKEYEECLVKVEALKQSVQSPQ